MYFTCNFQTLTIYLELYYVAVSSYNSSCDRTISQSNDICGRLKLLAFRLRNRIYKLIC